MTRPNNNKSKLSNGSKFFLSGADARGERARVFRDTYDSLIAQFPNPATAEVELCRRAAGLALLALDLESQLISDNIRDDLQAKYESLTQSIRRVLSTLKLPSGLPAVVDDDDRPKTVAEFMRMRGVALYPANDPDDGLLIPRERRPNLDNFKDPRHDDR